MNTTVTESLRGTLVPRAARTMKNWRATPSLAPQLMPRRAAGRRQMNSRSVPAAARPGPAKRESPAAQSAPLRAPSAEEETWGQKDGLGRGEHQSSSESISGGIPAGGRSGREDPRFGGNIHHSYHSVLSFGSQFHLKTQCRFFPLFSFEEKVAAGSLPSSARSC